MTAVARTERHRWHAPERGTTPAFLISLGAHTLLFVAIAFVVRWKTEPAGPVSAELWSALPPIAEPVPTPAPPPPPPPPVKIERAPEPEPVKPDIVLEQKKPEPKPEKKPEPVKKVEPAKKPEPDPKAEQRKRDEEARARKAEEVAMNKRQQDAIERAMAAAGAASPAGTASAAASPGLSDSYRGQIVGCIRPYIAFNVPDGLRPRQYVAEFEVSLLPSGEQVGAPRLVNASGLATFDQAVERAIRRCDPFPRPREGAMPRSVRLAFDPVEMR